MALRAVADDGDGLAVELVEVCVVVVDHAPQAICRAARRRRHASATATSVRAGHRERAVRRSVYGARRLASSASMAAVCCLVGLLKRVARRNREVEMARPPGVEVRGARAQSVDARRSSISAKPASSSSAPQQALGRQRERTGGFPAAAAAPRPCSTSTSVGISDHGLRSRASQTASDEAPAAAQHAPRLAQRRGGIDHQHVAPAAEHRVDARELEVDPFAVEHAELDVASGPAALRARARARDHRLRLVAADQRAAGLDQRGARASRARRCRRRARARAAPRRSSSGVDHPVATGALCSAHDGLLAPPAGGRRVPQLERSPAARHRGRVRVTASPLQRTEEGQRAGRRRALRAGWPPRR